MVSTKKIATSIALNLDQNRIDFELEDLEEAPNLFRKGLFSKTLNPPKEHPENIENYRTVTIKCLFKNCK